MIILFTFKGDPVTEFASYECNLQRDISKRIIMSRPLSWYDAYGKDAFRCMVNNAFNQSNIRNNIVLVPAYAGVIYELRETNRLKDVYWIQQPGWNECEEYLDRCKGYVIDFPTYRKFAQHVADFVKKEDKHEFWKWFKFDRGLY